MTRKLKVTKVDKKKKTITIDNCLDIKPIPIVYPPIWFGEMFTLDELLQELTKEELEKKYPKGST